MKKPEESIRNWIINDYNRFYVHSSLGYLSPEEFELKYYIERERNIA
ncbi:hypothetical protein THER_1357 [Thermodesulfovibrio sp. N1]|nr:hypothetical protein THER_1357 [Thermodesulfovibrio sp. N1]